MSNLPPKSPRVKIKKTTPQKKIVQTRIPDVSRISEGISDEVKIAIASALMAYSEMEMSAEHFIWDILALSKDDGRLVTQIDSKEKFILAKKLSARYQIPVHKSPDSARRIWASVDVIVDSRNKMAHGVWRMIDDHTPVVVSYRIPVDLGGVNSEHFPLERIQAITRNSLSIGAHFEGARRTIPPLPTRPVPQPQQPTPNHPEHPSPNVK